MTETNDLIPAELHARFMLEAIRRLKAEIPNVRLQDVDDELSSGYRAGFIAGLDAITDAINNTLLRGATNA